MLLLLLNCRGPSERDGNCRPIIEDEDAADKGDSTGEGNTLDSAGNDLEMAAGSIAMRRLSAAIPATALNGEWVGWRGIGRRLFRGAGRGEWWSAVC